MKKDYEITNAIKRVKENISSEAKFTEKMVRRAKIKIVTQAGRDNEKIIATVLRVSGYEVVRTGTGSDYKIKATDPITGKPIGDWIYVECKTGKAKLSPKQIEKQLEVGTGRYWVIRQYYLDSCSPFLIKDQKPKKQEIYPGVT